ncbi:MAG: hypothetical protein GW905_09680 [Rhodobacterales bacterium]|nr:hypothetical protein [Rhodobacterales bacterium]
MEQNRNKTSKPYSPEFRERSVLLVMEHRGEYRGEAAALTVIAGKLGCSPDSIRLWVRPAQRDGGARRRLVAVRTARTIGPVMATPANWKMMVRVRRMTTTRTEGANLP